MKTAVITVIIIVAGFMAVHVRAEGWNFSFDRPYTGLGRADDVAIADFNGDKRNDVVYSTAFVFLNKGGGAKPVWEKIDNIFKSGFAYQSTMGMGVGDFDHDGDQDIYTVDKTDFFCWIFENVNGDGKVWKGHKIGNIGEFGEEARVIDMNGDGREDIFSLARDSGPLYYFVQPQANPLSSQWTKYTIGTCGKGEGTMAFGDMDHDGDIDLYTQGFWFENTGNTQRNDWPRHAHPAADHKQQVADIDRDGNMDIVDGNTILFGPTFKEAVSSGANPGGEDWATPHGCVAVDLDRDGDLDVVLGGYEDPGVVLYENADGKGRLWKRYPQKTGFGHNLAAGDLNGDGMPDIVGKHYDSGKSAFDIWYNTLDPKVPAASRLTIWTSIERRKGPAYPNMYYLNGARINSCTWGTAESHVLIHGSSRNYLLVKGIRH